MRKSVEDIKHMLRAIPYPKPLPDGLEKWHVYTIDGGHCILCVRTEHKPEADKAPDRFEVPVPVKTVLRQGYKIAGDYVWISGIEYNSFLGLITPDEDHEF